MIDPALSGLIWTLMRAAIRQLVRKLRTPSGAIFALFMIAMISFGVVPQIALSLSNQKPPAMGLISSVVSVLPLAMYVAVVLLVRTNAGRAMLELRPAELQFVLAGPFSNAHILSYRLITIFVGWIFMSGFFALMMLVHFETLLGGYLFMLLGGAFIMMLTFLVTLLAPRLSRAGNAAIQIALLFGIAVIAFEVNMRLRVDSETGWAEAVRSAINESVSTQVLTLPFQPFTRLATESLTAGFALNVAVSLLLLGAVTFACYRLNAGFSELAVEGVARRRKKLERIKAGNVYATGVRKAERKSRLPTLPWWAGAGPIAWSQISMTLRRSGRLVPGIVLLGLVLAPIAVVLGRLYPNVLEPNQRMFAFPVAMGVATYVGFLLSMTMQSGFTANERLLTWYKTLPVGAMPLGTGMIAGTATLLLLVRLGVAFVGAAISNQSVIEVVSILVSWIAFDVVFVSMMNLVAVVTGVRPMPQGTPDIFQGARGIVYMMALGASMLPVAIVVTCFVGIAYAIAGPSWTACSLVAALAMLSMLPAIWFATGWRFQTR